MNLLPFCTNMFGTISSEIQKRLQAVIDNPTEDTWDDTHCLIISGHKTLWQYVLEVDPTFQRSAALCPDTYKTKWDNVPSSETIIQAIYKAVVKESLN